MLVQLLKKLPLPTCEFTTTLLDLQSSPTPTSPSPSSDIIAAQTAIIEIMFHGERTSYESAEKRFPEILPYANRFPDIAKSVLILLGRAKGYRQITEFGRSCILADKSIPGWLPIEELLEPNHHDPVSLIGWLAFWTAAAGLGYGSIPAYISTSVALSLRFEDMAVEFLTDHNTLTDYIRINGETRLIWFNNREMGWFEFEEETLRVYEVGVEDLIGGRVLVNGREAQVECYEKIVRE